jgi:hypothetical protein
MCRQESFFFLKTNPDGFEYYKKLEFVTLPADTSLPPGLSLLVPERNYATSSVDRTVLLSRRVVRDEQPSPPDSSPHADSKPPAVNNPSDLDRKPAALATDSDTRSRRSPRGKRDKPAAVEGESDTGSQETRRSLRVPKVKIRLARS